MSNITNVLYNIEIIVLHYAQLYYNILTKKKKSKNICNTFIKLL